MVAFTSPKRDELFPFSYTVKINNFFHTWIPLTGKALGLWHQRNPPVVVWWYENLGVYKYCSKWGDIKIWTAWVSTVKEESDQVIKDMQFVSKYTSSWCSSCKAFLGGYLGWILGSNGFLLYSISKGCALPWVQLLVQGEMNITVQPFFTQPECTAGSPVKAQLWCSHSAFKTSNPTHHKLSLQAFMADSKHMLIRELHPASSANGAVFLIKSMAYQGS